MCRPAQTVIDRRKPILEAAFETSNRASTTHITEADLTVPGAGARPRDSQAGLRYRRSYIARSVAVHGRHCTYTPVSPAHQGRHAWIFGAFACLVLYAVHSEEFTVPFGIVFVLMPYVASGEKAQQVEHAAAV